MCAGRPRGTASIGHRLLAECGQLDIDGEYPTVRGLPPGRHLVRRAPARGEPEHRKLRSAFMATPTQSSETLICRLFRDELSRLSLSLSPPARTCLKPVVLEGSDKDSGWRSRSRSVSIPFDRRCPMAKAPRISGLKPLVNGVSRHRAICVLLEVRH